MPVRRTTIRGLALCSLAVVPAALAVALSARAPGPKPAEPVPFFFIQITDPQLGFSNLRGNIAQDVAALQFAVATINRLQPAFVVTTGDLVDVKEKAEHIATYRRVMAEVDPTVPVYNVAGNHDVGNVPTLETLNAYRREFGPDRYVITRPGFTGIVINSSLAGGPQGAPAEAAAQTRWLEIELRRARASGVRHLVVFLHHPPYVQDPLEPDGYLNMPLEPRVRLLTLFCHYGVSHLFAGHLHRDRVVQMPDMEMMITGALARRSTDGPAGLRIVQVNGSGITHRFHTLGELPSSVRLPAHW